MITKFNLNQLDGECINGLGLPYIPCPSILIIGDNNSSNKVINDIKAHYNGQMLSMHMTKYSADDIDSFLNFQLNRIKKYRNSNKDDICGFGLNDYKSILILDKIDNKTIINNENIQKIWLNGNRHWKMHCVIAVNNCVLLNISFISNTDFVFVTKNDKNDSKLAMTYRMFFSSHFKRFDDFEEELNKHSFLVCNLYNDKVYYGLNSL